MEGLKNWRWEEVDRVLYLTLARDDGSTRISAETLYELRTITQAVNGRDDIWAVVLRSAGKHFSTGVDVNIIGMMRQQTEDAYHTSLRNMQDCLDQFESINKPTIAQIHGYCLGGGLLLALCCDFRIASDTTVIGLPEVRRSIGIIMGMQRITRIAGIARTKELAMLGDNINAQRSYEYGLLHDVVAHDELETTVATWVNKLRQLPPKAVALNKRIVDDTRQLDIVAAQAYEAHAQYPLLASDDFREAIASFIEKRPPNYTGN